MNVCDPLVRRFQTARYGNQELGPFQEQVRIRFVAEADPTVELYIFATDLQRRGPGHEQRTLDLESRIRPSLVDRNRCEARLIASTARRDSHVGAVMLHGLKAADGATKLRTYSGVGNGHIECSLGNTGQRGSVQQTQAQEL